MSVIKYAALGIAELPDGLQAFNMQGSHRLYPCITVAGLMHSSSELSGWQHIGKLCGGRAGLLPQRQDLWRVLALGLCLYFNQLFYIIGIDMSGVVVATCMQPTIPVFTAMIAVMLGLEAGSWQKAGGIVLAVGGSICMVSAPQSQHLFPGRASVPHLQTAQLSQSAVMLGLMAGSKHVYKGITLMQRVCWVAPPTNSLQLLRSIPLPTLCLPATGSR